MRETCVVVSINLDTAALGVENVGVAFRSFAIPKGPAMELGLSPRLESWNRHDDPAQVALRAFVAHVHDLIDPVIRVTAGELVFRLDVGLPEDVDPLWERDLDNYLSPIARTLPKRVVSVWGTKGRGMPSRVRVEPAVEVAVPESWEHFEVPRSDGVERQWKAAVRAAAARGEQLPAGPVGLQLSIVLGPDRSWPNAWKPSIDGLEPLLGRTYENRNWNPLDGRVVRLGLHRHVNAGLGHAMAMAVWARSADQEWPELGWFGAMAGEERATFMRAHMARWSRTRSEGRRSAWRHSQVRVPRRATTVFESPSETHGVQIFKDDDEGYRRWIELNPGGYVANIQRGFNPSDARLHDAGCRWISGSNPRRGPWTGTYIKVCSTSRDQLDAWALAQLGAAIPRCGTCAKGD